MHATVGYGVFAAATGMLTTWRMGWKPHMSNAMKQTGSYTVMCLQLCCSVILFTHLSGGTSDIMPLLWDRT